jgi:hypothetical protein
MNFPARKKFEEWLREKAPDALVGKCCSSGSCPIAKFLEARGAQSPYVRPDQTALNSYWGPSIFNSPRPLPQWANDFARKVDSQYPSGWILARYPSGWITAARCLEILNDM